MRPDAWRAPDGSHWKVTRQHQIDRTTRLQRAFYDDDTGQWACVHDGSEPQADDVRDLSTDDLEATYVPIAREPLRDPRITHLTSLVNDLLADYEAVTGNDAAAAGEIKAALAELAAEPERQRQRRMRGGARFH